MLCRYSLLITNPTQLPKFGVWRAKNCLYAKAQDGGFQLEQEVDFAVKFSVRWKMLFSVGLSILFQHLTENARHCCQIRFISNKLKLCQIGDFF